MLYLVFHNFGIPRDRKLKTLLGYHGQQWVTSVWYKYGPCTFWNNSRITQTTLPGTTLLNSQDCDWICLRDQNEDTKQKAQYSYTATQHLTQHRDRNASDNSMNTTPADLQITAETKVLHFLLLRNSLHRGQHRQRNVHWSYKQDEADWLSFASCLVTVFLSSRSN